MVWLLDLELSMRRILHRMAFSRVALSQKVWEHFVAIPSGIRGQCEGCRMWDLLCFLHSAFLFPDHSHWIDNRVGFLASVVNDNRDSGESMEDEDHQPTDFWLVAHRVVDDHGVRCLVVTLPHEDCLM